jgi:endonuclease/exonuclease/phosphatase family metal-dependent hydrolase
MVTYNLLQYDGTERNAYFKTVLDEIDPDFIIVQEIESQNAVDTFVETVLSNEFQTIPFHDGYTSDNHIFYNPFLMEVISAVYIPTDLRDIAEYTIRFPRSDDTLYVYSAHLKAGNPDFGDEDEDLQRLAEVTILRDNHLNLHPQGTKFIVSGDLNLYGADEPAYQKLLADEPGNFGQSFDPIDRPGGWHNNASFADIHSQSTRVNDLGDGGSTGGMDDRFDFILVSAPMVEKVESGSYMAYGNDGNHFNQDINNGSNSAVTAEVANALHAASDHLPVVADFDLSISAIDSNNDQKYPYTIRLNQNYPNPFNPLTTIEYSVRAYDHTPLHVNLNIYNMLGQNIATLVSENQNVGSYKVEWDAGDFSSGVYLYVLTVGNEQVVRKMLLLR